MVRTTNISIPTSHVTVFSHIWWFPYFFCLTFDDSIPTLCDSNITYDNSFVMLGGFLTFFLHLTVLSSHCAVPTSHVIVLYSNLVVHLFFFSYLTVSSSYCVVLTSNMSVFFSHLVVPLLFFLTFDGFILTLYGSNITCDSSFVTLGGSFTFFSHLTVSSSHYVVPTSYVTVLFSHLVIPLLFSHIWQF